MPQLPAEKRKVVLVDRTAVMIAMCLGALQAWAGRQWMNPDGVSYLDIGDAYLRGDWKNAINGYWSPLYSIWLGAAQHILKPSIPREFPVVHLVNFFIFLLALAAFRIFLWSTIKTTAQATDADTIASLPQWAITAIGYVIFLWSTLVLDDLILVTPDILLQAWIYLLGALLLELRTRNTYWKFAAFGVIYAFAYLTKGVMFPLSVVFFAVLLFSGPFSARRISGVIVAGIMFLLVASPFIYSLSRSKGRLTSGDTGKLAYAELVSPHTPQMHWQGYPPGGGIPVHSTRRILEDPPVFEFAQPIKGTYPPWYDPSYWNEGMRANFNLRAQVRVLVESALRYGEMLADYAPLLVAIIVLVLIGGRYGLHSIARNWPLVLISCAAAGLYGLVLVTTRYVAGFAALALVSILAGIRLPRDKSQPISNYITIAVLVAMFLTLFTDVGRSVHKAVTTGPGPSMAEQALVAQGLRNMGLRANDQVAVLGDGSISYWARLGRFEIIAEIDPLDPAGLKYWANNEGQRQAARDLVMHAGSRAIVAWNPPAGSSSENWKQVASTHYYAYIFQP